VSFVLGVIVGVLWAPALTQIGRTAFDAYRLWRREVWTARAAACLPLDNWIGFVAKDGIHVLKRFDQR
jgi:hypothetical protein